MIYRVMLHPNAHRFLEKADEMLATMIREKLKTLVREQTIGERLKMGDFRRLRIGDYRAIYEIDRDNTCVIVLFIGHRKDVYVTFPDWCDEDWSADRKGYELR